MAQGIEDVLGMFGGIHGRTAEEASEAVARRDAAVDVTFLVPSGGAAAVYRLIELLEQADGWAARGDLLTEPAAPEVVRFRRWVAQEVALQVDRAESWPFPPDTAPEA